MDISTRRLRYVLSGRTQTEVSRITGIPQSTISRVVRDEIALPKTYISEVRNFYQRDAYANLYASGANSVQSKRFSWYVPETVLQVTDTLLEARSLLEVHWLATKSYQLGRQLTGEEIILYRKEAEEGILSAMQKSKKTIEEIYTSGAKKTWSM